MSALEFKLFPGKNTLFSRILFPFSGFSLKKADFPARQSAYKGMKHPEKQPFSQAQIAPAARSEKVAGESVEGWRARKRPHAAIRAVDEWAFPRLASIRDGNSNL